MFVFFPSILSSLPSFLPPPSYLLPSFFFFLPFSFLSSHPSSLPSTCRHLITPVKPEPTPVKTSSAVYMSPPGSAQTTKQFFLCLIPLTYPCFHSKRFLPSCVFNNRRQLLLLSIISEPMVFIKISRFFHKMVPGVSVPFPSQMALTCAYWMFHPENLPSPPSTLIPPCQSCPLSTASNTWPSSIRLFLLPLHHEIRFSSWL